MLKEKIKLDYGSGYAPKAGYKTADIYGRPDFYISKETNQVIGLNRNSCKVVRMKNVFHHVLETEKLDQEMKRLVNQEGRLVVIEPTKEDYQANIFLDRLWYRGIIPRPEIVWSEKYRDIPKSFKSFKLLKIIKQKPYEIFIFTPRF